MSLTQETAEFRASVIRPNSISYNYNLILEPNQYFGLAEISFYLENLNLTELTLDFRGHIIQQVIVNSVKMVPKTEESQIFFPKAFLQKGRNKISIMYTNLYNNEQWGCISYIDEGWQLVYTDFEPYGANRVFPCFDQPNLKAKFKLAVVTPTTWTTTSNEPAQLSEKYRKEKYANQTKFTQKESNDLLSTFLARVGATTKMTTFDYTEFIPTYIFCFTAGNFQRIDSSTGTVPMSIFIAPSMYVQLKFYSSFIFDVTQKTMAFFEKLFGRRYPFKKYDQFWVRDMRFLAMENAGIVTFDESSLPNNPTQTDYYDLAEVIAHELSHHWFGNLVTMKWWDDLWLNQSFANFISMFALENINDTLAQKVQLPAVNFRETKVRGYLEDQRDNATHPIKVQVKDTTVAQSIFDGIIYGKGAAVMKQLYYLVGYDNYSKALTSYFSRFQWGNAAIDDLLEDMSPYFPPSISTSDWETNWLLKPSLNIFESIWDSTDLNPNATLILKQRPYSQQFPTLRPHQLEIAFFSETGDVVEIKQVLSNGQDSIFYDGTKQIKAIFVNNQDYSFLENYIDPVSLSFFMESILSIKQDTTRGLIWYNISAMVKQGLIRLDDYVTFISNNLFGQTLDLIVDKMLKQLYQWLNSYLPQPDNLQLLASIFERIYQQLQKVPTAQKDRIKILSAYYINFAINDDQVNQLINWLNRKDQALASKLLIDDDLKWQVVKKAFASGSLTLEEKETLFGQVELTDRSSRARDARIVCDTILANEATMETIYQSFRNNELSVSERKLRAEGWRNPYHYELLTDIYKDRYFADIVTLSTELEYRAFELFYTALRPIDDFYEDQISRYRVVIAQLSLNPDMAAHVTNINKIIDDLTLNIENIKFNQDSNLTLSQTRAVDRAAIVQGVSYNCHLAFQDGAEQYTAMVEITFTLSSLPKLLPIDFMGQEVNGLIVNGNRIEGSAVRTGEYLVIPRALLVAGVNVIGIYYTNSYNNDNVGCLSYVDSLDSDKQYICTNFEPYGAHRFIPCFDQPDLRAPVTFNVITSNPGWIVACNQIPEKGSTLYTSSADYIANSKAVANNGLLLEYLAGKSGQYIIFQTTQSLPTYVYTLIAGEYVSITLDSAKRYNNIPMTLYSIASMSFNLAAAADFWFEITSLALQYYQSVLAPKYMFSKYDTVFHPEILVGAMENPGLVVFRQGYLNYFRDPAPLQDIIYLATIIAHECAHMWFGNYVTPQWWSQIWLNESLADFFGFYCIAKVQSKVKVIPYPAELPDMLFLRQRASAYHEDQSSSTHPLINTVNSTSMAAALFDGINYQKGSALFKQLLFIMGETNFFNALKDYLQQNPFGSTNYQYFVDSFSTYFRNNNIKFEDWVTMWLKTVSPNILSVEWDPKDLSAGASLTINSANWQIIEGESRYHQINVAFFLQDGSFTTQQVSILPNSATTVNYDGRKEYGAILPNYDHQSFAKVRFDDTSLNYFLNNLNKIQDPLVRMVIWFYANEQVRDQTTKVADHLSAALRLLETEPEDMIFQFLMGFLNQSTGSYMPAKDNQPLRSSIFNFALQQLAALNTSINDKQNRVLILKEQLPRFCSTLDEIDVLELWREGNYPNLSNISISSSQAWRVVQLVFGSDRYDLNQKTAIFDDQKNLDSGPEVALENNTCLTITADSSTFKTVYQLFRTNETGLVYKNSLAKGWNNPAHLEWLQTTYKDQFFKDLTGLSKELTYYHFKFFYTSLKPIDDNVDDTLTRFQSIFLGGLEMEGPNQDILRIADEYQLRSLLFAFNALS